MRYRNLPGFSFVELMISIAIVGMLSVITVVSLNSTQKTDELRTATRQLAADIRSMQSRALSAQNIKSCVSLMGDFAVCENGTTNCSGTCAPATPPAFGLHLVAGNANYILFADVDIDVGGYKYTKAYEMLLQRDLSANSNNVIVEKVFSVRALGTTSKPYGDVTFLRQSGTTHLFDDVTPPEPVSMIIRLKHLTASTTMDIRIDQSTGRVSIL